MLHVIPHSHFDVIWRSCLRGTRSKWRAMIYRRALALAREASGLPLQLLPGPAARRFSAKHRAKNALRVSWWKHGPTIGGPCTIRDLNLSSGELILRNQLQGLRWFHREFGLTITTACMEDAFGLPASPPADI